VGGNRYRTDVQLGEMWKVMYLVSTSVLLFYEEILMLQQIKYLWFLGSIKIPFWTVFIAIGPGELTAADYRTCRT